MYRPIIGISMGDPAGNGPELSVKALGRSDVYDKCRPIIVGDARMIKRAAEFTKRGGLKINPVSDVSQAEFRFGTVDVLHMDLISDPDVFILGKVSSEGGNAAFQSVVKLIDLAMSGLVDATVTNALNKEAMNLALAEKGLHFDGHTEIYAKYTDTEKYSMMLAHKDFRVLHVSTHCSLREACERVKKDRISECIELADRALRELGIENPRIAVAALNPHAGEHGLFGREEIEEIIPAVEEARAAGINAAGPLPADSVFPQMKAGMYDIVVCMYHDQGHIPIKTIGFAYDAEKQSASTLEGVNITLGLPIIRTSVDHGTGFALAGKGVSSELSLLDAIDCAVRLSLGRRSRS